jgi:hypothetical protein
MRSLRFLSHLLVAAWFWAGGASAAVPSAARSKVDPCLRICPAGDMNFHVVVHDAANNPKPGAAVVIDLCQCPGVALCALTGGEAYSISGCTVSTTANAAGAADFLIRAGGTCASGVHVLADGVMLAINVPAVSPDQNGDLVVDGTDQAILAAKIGGPFDRTGDLNCSGTLDASDQNILAAHLDHSCARVVPVRPSSWGTIKMLYR